MIEWWKNTQPSGHIWQMYITRTCFAFLCIRKQKQSHIHQVSITLEIVSKTAGRVIDDSNNLCGFTVYCLLKLSRVHLFVKCPLWFKYCYAGKGSTKKILQYITVFLYTFKTVGNANHLWNLIIHLKFTEAGLAATRNIFITLFNSRELMQ